MPSKDEVDNAIIAGSNASIIGAVAGIANNAQLRDLNRQAAYQNETLQQIADQSAAQLQAINQQTLMQSQAFAEIKAKVDAGNEIQKQQLSVIQDAAENTKRVNYANWLAINPNGQYYEKWENQAKQQLAMILDATQIFNRAYSEGLKKQSLRIASKDPIIRRIDNPERMRQFVEPERETPKPKPTSSPLETFCAFVFVTGSAMTIAGVFLFLAKTIFKWYIPGVTDFFGQYFWWILGATVLAIFVSPGEKPVYDPEGDRINIMREKWYKTHFHTTEERDEALAKRYQEIYKTVEEDTKPETFGWCVDEDLEQYTRRIIATMNDVAKNYPTKDKLPRLKTLVINCSSYTTDDEVSSALFDASMRISDKYNLPIDYK